MLIIYRDGEVQNQIVAWGGDRERRLEGKSGRSDPPMKLRILRVLQNWRQCWSYAVQLYLQLSLEVIETHGKRTLETSPRMSDRNQSIRGMLHVEQQRRRGMKILDPNWICNL